MTRLFLCLSLFVTLVLGAGAASAEDFDFATGEHKGHLQVAFTAHDTTNGPIGRIKLQFEPGVRIFVEVDCLNVVGHLASVQGPVIFSNHPDVTGGRVEVEIEDNGEANPGHTPGPDKLQVNFDQYPQGWTTGAGPDCSPNTPPFNRTLDGNVEVYDAS